MDMNVVQGVVETKLGPVSVLVEDGFAVEIALGRVFDAPIERVEPFVSQIEEYFSGLRETLNFPVLIKGTDFQRRVWKLVREIPYGSVRTYGSIAKELKTSPRAVGTAMRTNRLPLYIPCHRVVARDGMGGFSVGMEWKRFLLELEGVIL